MTFDTGWHVNPLAGADRRVCQSLFSDMKARSKALLRYASAERMRNPLAGLNSLHLFSMIHLSASSVRQIARYFVSVGLNLVELVKKAR
jgi:hypothetical protein